MKMAYFAEDNDFRTEPWMKLLWKGKKDTWNPKNIMFQDSSLEKPLWYFFIKLLISSQNIYL